MTNHSKLRSLLNYLVTVSFLILASSQLLAQNIPGDHSRWIGDIEGPVVDERGSANVYEFHFEESGKVKVFRHMPVEKREQTFDFEMAGLDIKLIGDSNGPIGELAGQTLRHDGDTKYVFKFIDGETDIVMKKSIRWLSWLNIAFIFVMLFVGAEITSRFKWAPYVFFLVLPLCLIPLWMTSDMGWFRYAKLIAIIVGAMFITITRFNLKPKHIKYGVFLVVFGLAFNILEAVTQDFSQPFLPNKLNALAGFMNILTIYLWTTIRINNKKPHNFQWPGMVIFWIIAYDLWNICFVYLNFPNTVHYTALAVIPVPTIIAIFLASGKFAWIQARAYSLVFYMIYVVTISTFDMPVSLVEPLPRGDGWIWALVILSLGSNVVLLVLQWRYRLTKKAPKNIDVGQNAVEGTPPMFG